MRLPNELRSKKLLGFVIAIVGLIVIGIVSAFLASEVWGSVINAVLAVTGLHQGAQGATDVAKARNGTYRSGSGTYPPPAPPQPPTSHIPP